MRKTRIVALAALVVMLATSLAYAGPTYDRVMQEKVCRVGLMANSKPAGFINENGDWIGFDVDIATELCRRLGVKIEKVQVNNKTRVTMVQTGQIDMSLANMTHKRERDKSIDFSITYFFDGQKFLVRKGTASSWQDLVGKKIASMQGTTSELNVRALLKKLGDPDADNNVISYQNEAECFQALKMGRVAAWSTDSTLLIGYAAEEPGKFELIGDFFSNEPYGVGLPEDDSAWRDAINFALQDMWQDGTYKKIYDKWYGPESKWAFPLTDEIELWP
ncbi:amino acid ABC transporter substrate-binding protein, PAAT family [Paucidesulfovibrio gracilis DSM 16080]|uniref:Amino acid ABC transporter substrate-binding protein, PAAT family n=1 Tax=Paucidesulfovibrio gracilis DSM 16080 TaxID=1121449 RepID=A0A1T4WKM6_9BACT|nr:transporter substrate-binding domain-containing protein [Paucidesulfovibrio gracilis]SKA77854.1 amino acid ABC transporter substrate-binding protein, PAAT family [Paucidesulfovibrio gracilis DSM 16080]